MTFNATVDLGKKKKNRWDIGLDVEIVDAGSEPVTFQTSLPKFVSTSYTVPCS